MRCKMLSKIITVATLFWLDWRTFMCMLFRLCRFNCILLLFFGICCLFLLYLLSLWFMLDWMPGRFIFIIQLIDFLSCSVRFVIVSVCHRIRNKCYLQKRKQRGKRTFVIFPADDEKLQYILNWKLKTNWRWKNVIFTDEELRFEC